MSSAQPHVSTSAPERPPSPVRPGPRSLFTLEQPSDEHRTLRVGVVAGVAVVMVVVGFWGLDRGSMWLDEAASYTVATRPAHQILAVLRHIDVVHGVYYLGLHLWMQLGTGEAWMRVPSVVGMAVAAGATAALGMRLAGARTGLVAGLLFAGWPFVSHYAQEGRSFALVTGAVLLGTWCLVQALSGRERWWWGYAASMVVATTLNELGVLALGAHVATMLLARPGRRAWRWWVASVAGCAVLMAPVAVLSLRQSSQVSHTAPLSWSTVGILAEKFFGSSPWVLGLVIGLIVVGVAAEAQTWRRHEGGGLAAVAVPLLLIPVLALVTISLVQPLLEARYVLFCVAGLPLLAARGVEQLAASVARATSRSAAGWAVAAVLVAAVSVLQLPALRHERTLDSRSQDFAGAAAVLRAQARPGDAVLFVPVTFRLAAMAYPDGFARVDDVALARSAVQAGNLRGTVRSPADVRRAMLARQRIWVLGTRGLRIKDTDKAGTNEMAVLGHDFVQQHRTVVQGVEIDLYVRTRP